MLFAGLAGDFSPLSVDGSAGTTRHAQPALLTAAAIGLGSMDMPLPQIASWEWANWRFPKPVKAGETIYARWTLTQKRPPVGGSPTAVVVWRVDVHTADGALCAEGEVGASVFRRKPGADRAAAPASSQPASRRRRRRRGGAEAAAPAAAAAAPAAPAPAPAPAERPSSPRRRRRRRSSGGGQAAGGGNGEPAPPPPPAPTPAPDPAPKPAPRQRSGLRSVIGRLRRS